MRQVSRRSFADAVRAVIACALLLVLGTVPALAAEPSVLSKTKYTNGASVRRAFLDVVADANEWTVRIRANDDDVAFGAVIRADGHILTKASQLQGDLSVRLYDGRVLSAEYVGYSPEHDVALLRIAADGLPAVQWQERDDPAIGSWVVTPDQEGAPCSVGVVSVARREIPRNSQPALLGITMANSESSQVLVQEVAKGSAAERAGLLESDVIVMLDDVTIRSSRMMVEQIARRAPGDTVTLQIDRNGKTLTLRATLTHPFGPFQSRIAMQNQMGGELSERRSGFPVVLQHDSVLGPEECGGPLIDLAGRAIGINIARAGRTETYAIPDDVLRPLIDELLSGRYPPPGEHTPTLATEPGQKSNSDSAESDTAEK
jgi:serine protease Do